MYCGRLSLVSDLLQGLFKEAYALQKGLMEVLDRISLDTQATEEDVTDIVTGVCVCVYVSWVVIDRCIGRLILSAHICVFFGIRQFSKIK